MLPKRGVSSLWSWSQKTIQIQSCDYKNREQNEKTKEHYNILTRGIIQSI